MQDGPKWLRTTDVEGTSVNGTSLNKYVRYMPNRRFCVSSRYEYKNCFEGKVLKLLGETKQHTKIKG